MPPPSEPDAALGAALRRYRLAARLTQEDVAHEAGLTTTTYARIELAQSSPAWATVRRIADALGLSLDELGRLVEAEGRRA